MYLCVRIILGTNSDFSLNSIKQWISVTEMFFFLEVGTVFLNIIQMNFLFEGVKMYCLIKYALPDAVTG
jgi:hypothetical protein